MKLGKRWLSLLLAAMMLLGLACVPVGAAQGQMNGAAFLAQLDSLGRAAEGTRLVVKTADGNLPDDFGAQARREGYNAWHVLQYADKAAADRAYAQLAKQRGVVYVEVSRQRTYIDPIITNEGAGNGEEAQPMSWGAPMVQSPQMKKALADSGKELPVAVVAILDTGLDFTHPYFVENAHRVTGRFTTDLKNYAQDDHGHGTHVAGIICDNAPDNVKVSPYKVLTGGGWGDDIYIATAMCAAADDGVDVISMSLGGPRGSIMDDAVVYAYKKGVPVVVSAGNDGWDASNNSPAGEPLAITVSAVNKDSTPADFSNYGAVVDIAAPGGTAANNEWDNGINSTTPLFTGSYYQKWSGTSMACPFVSAAAAVVKSLHPDYSPADIENALKRAARWTSGWDSAYGAGILDCMPLLNLPELGSGSGAWWEDLPAFVQWLLKYVCFGWLWM